MFTHLARAADALEHAQEDEDPSSKEAQGQGPPDRAWVMEALTVHYTQHSLTATYKTTSATTTNNNKKKLLPNLLKLIFDLHLISSSVFGLNSTLEIELHYRPHRRKPTTLWASQWGLLFFFTFKLSSPLVALFT